MTFTMPVWISPPAKVYQQRVIQQITNRINNFPDDFDPDAYDFFGNGDVGRWVLRYYNIGDSENT